MYHFRHSYIFFRQFGTDLFHSKLLFQIPWWILNWKQEQGFPFAFLALYYYFKVSELFKDPT
jgi:hypothetical protein